MRKVWLFVSTILFSVSVFAFDVPAPSWYVLDLAWVLSYSQGLIIENQIETIQDQTSVEIWILLTKTLDWESISDVATRVGNKWWVGKKWKDNGVVLLIAVDDRDWFIATWYWIEWILPDAIARRIGANNFPINFRQWNYYEWIQAAINDMGWYILKEPDVIDKYSDSAPVDDSLWRIGWIGVIFSLLMIAVLVYMLFKRWFSKDTSLWNKFIIALISFFIALVVTLVIEQAIPVFFVVLFMLFWWKLWNTRSVQGWGSWWWFHGGFGWWSFGWWGAGGKW